MFRRTSALALFTIGLLASWARADDAADAKALLDKIGVKRGLCVVFDDKASLAIPLAQQSELTVFVQLHDQKAFTELCKKADAAGLYGTRVYVQKGKGGRLNLADDLADAVVVGKAEAFSNEVMRVLRPGGKLLVADLEIVKPRTKGTDEWTHPYHGPDNNPQSLDEVARRPFLTHFLAEPWYCPLTQMTVASGGRLFKVFGDRSSAKPQEALLNKMLCMSAFNGTILWTRDLSPGFLIHRNTLIATPDTVFLADDKSCKLIDAVTGNVKGEVVVPEGISDGPVWKWMAYENGILYALVGEKEDKEIPQRGDRIRGAGWPWWKYKDYKYGFGKTLMAVDPKSKKVLWHHKESEPIDARAVCLKNGRLYFYSEQKFLACLDAKAGKQLWRNSDPSLLDAIAPTGSAQHPMLGFASTAYMKCSDEVLFFGGPQRPNVVGASAKDGKLLWKHAGGNSQLVLRPEGLYALGEGRINSKTSSLKIEPKTGKILETFDSRDRCTRATGCIDSIFTRGGAGGSTAVFDVTATKPRMGTLAPMRPACTDGVLVANGYLYWGPWMCACDQTQIGVISLGPGGKFDYAAKATDKERLERVSDTPPLPRTGTIPGTEWSTYRKTNARSVVTSHFVPEFRKWWEYKPPHATIPTAPVYLSGKVYVSGSDGVVRALNYHNGELAWSAYTGGPVKYPPSIDKGLAYVGSGDGWIYCFDARSGQSYWRFRAAPAERVIPVHGSLSSNWPVGSGVLVDNGVVYAAAGMFNYDGTHVYALDARTGELRWQNSTSGHLGKEDVDTGVSVQGHLLLHASAIHMPAGNKPTVASYSIKDGTYIAGKGQGRGKHLYVSGGQVKATGFPLYWRPDDDHFLTNMEVDIPGGTLELTTTAPKGGPQVATRIALGKRWSVEPFHEVAALAVGKNAVVVTGVNRDKNGSITGMGICAISLEEGKIFWREPLPAPPVAWGLAMYNPGRIVVTLMDGRVLGYDGR